MFPRPLVGWERVEFGQLILRKIIKIVAMSDLKTKIGYTKIYLQWGSLQRSRDPLAGFKWHTSRDCNPGTLFQSRDFGIEKCQSRNPGIESRD